ncbi:MAG: class I SAM-dependent methyltransferase [Phycisphaerae bacterium]|nr:class I SAM-dependent methyltransferase [Phycisphaerae bacterium]
MKRLTNQETWHGRHTEQRISASRTNRIPWSIRQQHALLQRILPTGPDVKTLEVGCYPGGFLKYFHRTFGHTVTGLEYVLESCDRCKAMLEAQDVPATVIHGDLFKDKWNTDQSLWDVVFSAGLIEHFDDSSPAIEKHLQLVSPGGHCIITLPNHSGLNGRVMKSLDRPMWDLHNKMCAKAVQDAFERSPSAGRFELLGCHYVEHFGLWNCGVYQWIGKPGKPGHFLGRGIGAVAEASLRWLPNTRLLSPNIIMIARAQQEA